MKKSGLIKLWMICGSNARNKRVVPINGLTNHMSEKLISVLPVVHALTGCDTTSKVGTKVSALNHLWNTVP